MITYNTIVQIYGEKSYNTPPGGFREERFLLVVNKLSTRRPGHVCFLKARLCGSCSAVCLCLSLSLYWADCVGICVCMLLLCAGKCLFMGGLYTVCMCVHSACVFGHHLCVCVLSDCLSLCWEVVFKQLQSRASACPQPVYLAQAPTRHLALYLSAFFQTAQLPPSPA